MNEKPAYYAIIPANVRYDKKLKPMERLLYGEITALCNEKGYCWANNEYFANLYGVTTVSISSWVSNLVKQGYITREIIYKEGTKEILNRYIRILCEGIKENFNTPIKEIFKDNNTVVNNTINNTYNNIDKSKKFIKPTIDEIKEHLQIKGIQGIDAEQFYHFYESKGWKVGNNPMKNWHSAIQTWRKNKFNQSTDPVQQRKETGGLAHVQKRIPGYI